MSDKTETGDDTESGKKKTLKLGVIAEEYHRNVYGESTSVLHKGTPTDRLVSLKVTKAVGF